MKRLLIICHEERDFDCTCHDCHDRPHFMQGHGEMMACRKVHLNNESSGFPDWLKDFFEKLDTEDPPEDLMDWL